MTTALFLWNDMGYNLITAGWLVVLEVLYALTLVCLPLIGLGLQRVRVAAFKSRRTGRTTPELEEAMSDSVPLVFSGIATIAVPAMAFLSVTRPF